MTHPSYYSIITADVRYDKNLSANEKLLYAEISSLINMNGECRAENSYFASLYNVHLKTISVWINKLIKRGYLSSRIEYIDGTKTVDTRVLTLSFEYQKNTPEASVNGDPSPSVDGDPSPSVDGDPLHPSMEVYINTPTECIKECPKQTSDNTFSEFDIRISKKLFDYLKSIHSTIKVPDFKKWAKHVRDMRVLDNRKEEGIENVLKLIFEGNTIYSEVFWRSNIRSTEKLRAQYDTIALQINGAYARHSKMGRVA